MIVFTIEQQYFGDKTRDFWGLKYLEIEAFTHVVVSLISHVTNVHSDDVKVNNKFFKRLFHQKRAHLYIVHILNQRTFHELLIVPLCTY